MLEWIKNAWAKYEKNLIKNIEKGLDNNGGWYTPYGYEDLMFLITDNIINPYLDKEYTREDIETKTIGSYQGKHYFYLGDKYKTYIWYGSCSVCDTLLAANSIEDHKRICLNILQNLEKVNGDNNE